MMSKKPLAEGFFLPFSRSLNYLFPSGELQRERARMKKASQSEKTPRIVVVYCHNAMSSAADLREGSYSGNRFTAFFAALPCSSKIEPSYVLKMLADGADGVVVVACPENQCRYMVGNVRAEKRINYVRTLLDQAKMGAERLVLERGQNLTADDLLEIAQRRLASLKSLGPNPMKGAGK
jgi:coenzyme F420-reducing hydrogenase delta subunit